MSTSRQTRDSFRLSGREVPEGFQRSPRVQEYLDRHTQHLYGCSTCGETGDDVHECPTGEEQP
jgi:hypothetical protein